LRLSHGKLRTLIGKAAYCAVPIIALCMLCLILTPVGMWSRPDIEAIYKGFDPNLVYEVQKAGNFQDGIVEVSQNHLKLISVPTSHPTVHLVSSELNYRAAMNVRVLDSQPGTVPLEIRIWSPRKEAGYSITFESSPQNLITAQVMLRDTILDRTVLGTYQLRSAYHVELSVDRERGTIQGQIRPLGRPSPGSNMVLLVGGPDEANHQELYSRFMQVEGGKNYIFGGQVRRVSGPGWYKIVVDWLDNKGERIGHANEWQPPTELGKWTPKRFLATAPNAATFAQIILGAGSEQSQYMMTDLFLKKPPVLNLNLLSNGDFEKGFENWKIIGGKSESIGKVFLLPTVIATGITTMRAPDLFLKLPLALTLAGSSKNGLAIAQIEDYSLTVPSQIWPAMRVQDRRATATVMVLLVLGCFATIVATVLRLRTLTRKLTLLSRNGWSMGKQTLLGPWPILVGFGSIVAAYILINALLFPLGYHAYDLIGEKIWAYVGTRYGLTSVYQISSLVTPADAWGGVPFAPSDFPYGPLMAYIFTGIGWIYRLFLADPSGLRLGTFQLDVLIKTSNVIAGLADSFLIYLILSRCGMSRRSSLLSTSLFLFNPAVWLVMSVWGETHTISLLFVLLAIWFGETNRQVAAWLAIAMTSFTRLQLLIPALLLSLIFLRKFPLKINVYAISWSIILGFLILAPFTLALGPSAPLNIILQGMRTQNPTDPRVGAYFYASLQALNLWPLVSRFTGGFSSSGRFFFPSTNLLVGHLTYVQVSDILFLLVFLSICFGIIRSRRILIEGRYLTLVAIGILALLLLRTGIADHYFVLALPFIVVARVSLNRWAYYSIIITLTLTTFVSCFGDLGIASSQVGFLMPALYYQNNMLTRFFIGLINSDWFITVGSLVNLLALVWLVVEGTRSFLFPVLRGS